MVIGSAENLGILKILNLIANEKDVNRNNTRKTNSAWDILNAYDSIFYFIGITKDVYKWN